MTISKDDERQLRARLKRLSYQDDVTLNAEDAVAILALIDAAEAAATARRLHASDCAVNNRPALPAGPCTCGADTGNTPDAIVQAIAAEAAEKARDAALDAAWERINTLCGSSSARNDYEAGFNSALDQCLMTIEDLGGRDPLIRARRTA